MLFSQYIHRQIDTHTIRPTTTHMNTGCLQRTFKYIYIYTICASVYAYIQIAVYVYFTNLLNCAYGAFNMCAFLWNQLAWMEVHVCWCVFFPQFAVDTDAAAVVVCCVVVMQLQIAQNQMAKLTVTINCCKFLLMADCIQVETE